MVSNHEQRRLRLCERQCSEYIKNRIEAKQSKGSIFLQIARLTGRAGFAIHCYLYSNILLWLAMTKFMIPYTILPHLMRLFYELQNKKKPRKLRGFIFFTVANVTGLSVLKI